MLKASGAPYGALPVIRRARGYRLYGSDGKRYLDLWQDGGGALLGHTPARLLTVLKDTASRGLYAPFPHPAQVRLEKALGRFFPGGRLSLFASEAAADEALASSGSELRIRNFLDPALSFPAEAGRTAELTGLLWRPFLDESEDAAADTGAKTRVLAPVLPVPGPWRPLFLLSFDGGPDLSPSQPLSPLVAALALRALVDLEAALKAPRLTYVDPFRGKGGIGLWTRRGRYFSLSERFPPEAYASLAGRFLAEGLVLPPSQGQPAILPGELSTGESAALSRALSFQP